ncbi:hypothetical protein EXM22_01805 [Oceanispirochaeta crateris]|uniref:PepSY domain-containing protein n=1 Tax=Oceanispirochaeta crateris TaxID=2518645 RepID=A0A5C1QJU5_9SPIO|nr:hypothetical protein [Oceanispirochaeta crateris]QEN06786.1 hypothetical protein EXM22_01805 [Oceanispirochaeta crateris]
MNQSRVTKLSVFIFFLLAITSLLSANGNKDDKYNYNRSRGFGRMGGGGYGHMGQGQYGNGHSMMGYGFYNNSFSNTGERMTHDEIEENLKQYINDAFGKDFHIEEIMEFQRNYYAQVVKEGEDHLAVELLIDPFTGQVFPEPGPNMMWNQSYGHMGRRFWNNGKVKISAEESVTIAQDYLDYKKSGFTADDHVSTFDGYYTLHTLKEGQIVGMLSVNGVSGDVWYHDWHGGFLGMDESVSHDN